MDVENKQIRKAYETPILWEDLRSKITENIRNSGLTEYEVEAIIKDIYIQVREQAAYALQLAKKLQNEELNDKGSE